MCIRDSCSTVRKSDCQSLTRYLLRYVGGRANSHRSYRLVGPHDQGVQWRAQRHDLRGTIAATGLSLTQAWRTYSATTTPQVRRLSTVATDKALNPRVVGPGRRRSEGGHLTPLSPPTGVLTRIRDPRLAIASRPVFRNRNPLRNDEDRVCARSTQAPRMPVRIRLRRP